MNPHKPRFHSHIFSLLILAIPVGPAHADSPLIPKRATLERETFWDNRDWDWYQTEIPFFECPDAEIQTTYYYRWELLTKHLTYGSIDSGYSFTEFIDRPFWSGAYGAISCPSGHQLSEARWLRSPRYARDYAQYYFRTPGAQPRNYSCWLAASLWDVHQVHPSKAFCVDLLDDLVRNHSLWRQRHFDEAVGLYWQTGHDDGMEFNINSRQTADILRGAPAYRPTFNSYMWADSQAIARIARLAGRSEVSDEFTRHADSIKQQMQDRLWDPKRNFFFPLSKQQESREGAIVSPLTLTYETGKFANDSHGRELIGYVPWQFNLLDTGKGFEKAWRYLMSPDHFAAPFGPTTVERNDPQFLLQNSCCWWSGQSWPYATTQTLKALANLLQNVAQDEVTRADYRELLETYARSHRKNGVPYLAEALHPFTGSFEGHDAYNHSEHYFHSGYCDLILTGLVGIEPQDNDTVVIDPLAPESWDYFAAEDVPYHGRLLSVAWDREGKRYGLGAGLHVLLDGVKVAHSPSLRRLEIPVASLSKSDDLDASTSHVNFAVNNDGDYFPRITASSTASHTSPAKLIDGNYWYHRDPPNRWTSTKGETSSETLELDFGIEREIDTVKLYFLDDHEGVLPPTRFELQRWNEGQWQALSDTNQAAQVLGRRATIMKVPKLSTSRLRLTLECAPGATVGLTEWEVWGEARLPVTKAKPPAGNLAFNPGNRTYPRVSASHTSRFDRLETVNDGRVVYAPTPANRWTSYESKSSSDWLQVDFDEPKQVERVVLHFYDDRGGVQPPSSYTIESLSDGAWHPVSVLTMQPREATGGLPNEVTFQPVETPSLRVVLTHQGAARSGMTEIEIW